MATMIEPAPIALDGSEDEFMSINDMAKWLHVAYSTVYEWVHNREPKMPSIERAGRTYTTKAAYYRWLAAQNGRTP